MIKLTRLNKSKSTIVLNSDLIQLIEATPDTVITLVTGEKMVVGETVDEVIEQVIAFRRKTAAASHSPKVIRLLKQPHTTGAVEDNSTSLTSSTQR